MKTILVDAVDTLIIEGQGINSSMQALLDSYPNNKIILTNADDAQFVTYGLDRGMPYEVFTLKHNPDKTDPHYFKTLLEHYHLAVGDVIYFEHNEEAVKSAQSIGITSYLYDPGRKDLAALGEFLAQNAS